MAKNPLYVDKIIISNASTDNGVYLSDGTSIVDSSGNIDAPVTTSNLTTSGNTTLGDTSADALSVPSTSTFSAPVTVGVDGTGYDVKLFGDTAGAYMLWDESADDLILAGAAGLSVAGATTFSSTLSAPLTSSVEPSSKIVTSLIKVIVSPRLTTINVS